MNTTTASGSAAKKKILVLTDWFVPGYKAGGPIRSVANFVEHMQGRYELFVFTRDRDLHSESPYEGIIINEWVSFGECVKVCYASPDHLSWSELRRVFNEVAPDFIYLNSMFSYRFSLQVLMMRRLGLIHNQVVLAPRGMLRASAIEFKKRKKELFLLFCRLGRLKDFVQFHATDITEEGDIRKHLGQDCRIEVIPNFPALLSEFPGAATKLPGQLRIVFIGRLHPVKNLDFLLQVLQAIHAEVQLTVVGSEEDQEFTQHCKTLATALPANVRVSFAGEIPHDELPLLIRQHHVLALPSRGENYGHAIFESLQQGRPVLISDQTPWRNLESMQAGWDLPLDRMDLFRDRIEEIASWDQQQYDSWSKGAWEMARLHANTGSLKEKYSALFS